MIFLVTAVFTAGFLFFLVPAALVVGQLFACFVIVEERRSVIYELFGQVRLVISDPGLHFPWMKLGPLAALLPFFGKRYVVDHRLDQTYLRSQPVNSEEGAPMGIGVWYEMFVSDPASFLYKNWDPVGSLRANVSNATVRCLSNMKLADMLETRHAMSQVVREEVSSKSRERGYMLGSTYIRKVHFRDLGMIQQIEQKVVNRLRQVTAAIQQDGTNRVNVIRSTAERQAAVAFAQAAATRPRIVGAALGEIAKDSVIASALFELLETQNLLASPGLEVSVLPQGTQFVAAIPSTIGAAAR